MSSSQNKIPHSRFFPRSWKHLKDSLDCTVDCFILHCLFNTKQAIFSPVLIACSSARVALSSIYQVWQSRRYWISTTALGVFSLRAISENGRTVMYIIFLLWCFKSLSLLEMWNNSYFLFFLTLFCQFEEEFLETRDQYEKLLQGESRWNFKKSVTRLRDVWSLWRLYVSSFPHRRVKLRAVSSCIWFFPYGDRWNCKLSTFPACTVC